MNDGTLTRYRFEARFTLIQLGVIQGVLGLYALFFPRSFYEDFPLGLGWVEALPAYNEHLLTDFGGLFLTTAVILLAAVGPARAALGRDLARRLPRVQPASHDLAHLQPGAVLDRQRDRQRRDARGDRAAAARRALPGLARKRRPAQARARSSPGRTAFASRAVPDSTRNPMTRISYAISRRRYGDVVEPMRVFAHNPTVMTGYSMHELATERATSVPERLKHLASMRAAMVAGCEWCLDFGSFLSKGHGVTEDEMRELPHYRDSDAFDETEKLVMDYAERDVTEPCRGLRRALRAAPRAVQRGPARRADGHRRARELPSPLQLGLRPGGPGLLGGSVLRPTGGAHGGRRPTRGATALSVGRPPVSSRSTSNAARYSPRRWTSCGA